MNWTDHYLKLPSQAVWAELEPLLRPEWHYAYAPVEALNTGTEYFVNVRANKPLPEAFETYTLPAPQYPKQVFA